MYDFQFQCKKKGIDVIIGESADIKGEKPLLILIYWDSIVRNSCFSQGEICQVRQQIRLWTDNLGLLYMYVL